MATARINGTRLFYEVAGSGPPCIVLHGGLGFDHTYMRKAFGPLEDVGRFVYVDQRGNGRSDRPSPESITMQQLAADIDALREHLGLDRVGITGHSFGGFVALEYATTYPERLSHLLLLSTSPGVFEPTPDELAERGDRSWVDAEVEVALAAMFSVVPADDEAFKARLPMIAPSYVRIADPNELVASMDETIFSASAVRRGFEVLPGWSVVDKLGVIDRPTLVVCGRHDLHTTPECSKRLAAAIPAAELVWFENSAHFPWFDEPNAFDAVVRDWLKKR